MTLAAICICALIATVVGNLLRLALLIHLIGFGTLESENGRPVIMPKHPAIKVRNISRDVVSRL
jgi:hypothetical protein